MKVQKLCSKIQNGMRKIGGKKEGKDGRQGGGTEEERKKYSRSKVRNYKEEIFNFHYIDQ